MQPEETERILDFIEIANQYLNNLVEKFERETGKKAMQFDNYTKDFLKWKAKKEV